MQEIFRYRLGCLIVCLGWVLAANAHAQSRPTELLQEIRTAYNQLDYAQAEARALAALETYQAFSVAQLTEIHTTLALIYYTQNRIADARAHFVSALNLTPDLTLDPSLVSPKIVRFFEQVKEELQAQNQSADRPEAEVRYVLVQDPRSTAALRSMLLPGWGQHYKGEHRKGWIVVGLWSVGLVGTVTAAILRADAEKRYLDATDPDEIEARYTAFNTWHKVRNSLLAFTAAVWAYGFFDALLKPAPRKEAFSTRSGLKFVPLTSPRFPGVSIQYRF